MQFWANATASENWVANLWSDTPLELGKLW